MVARLSLDGSRILDQNGHAIKLRFINEARWNTMVEQDAADHVAQGFDGVRLPLRWWGKYGGANIDSRDDTATGTALIDPAHLAILDNNVAWCAAQHLWIGLFIDSNCGQCGVQDGETTGFCDPQNLYGADGHNFFTDLDERALYLDVLAFIANRYKNTPYIAWIEPLPEPNAPTASAADITTFYQEAMAAVTAVDPTSLFLIGPGNGYDIRIADTAYIPGATNVIYTGNLFVHTGADVTDTATRLQHLLDLRTAHNVPIFVQQVGVRSGDDPSMFYQDLVLTLLNQNQVGWSWWAAYGGSTSPDEYEYRYKDAKNPGKYITKTAVLNKLSAYAIGKVSSDETTLVQHVTDVLQASLARQDLLGGAWNAVNTEEPPTFPFIVFQRIVSTTNSTLQGPSDMQSTRIQIDVLDRQYGAAAALAKQVALDLLAAFPQCVPLSSFDVYEGAIKAHRISADYSIWSTA
jgi:hypothetical protein